MSQNTSVEIRHLPRSAGSLRRMETKAFRDWEEHLREGVQQEGIDAEAVDCLVRWAKKKFAEYKTPPAPADLDNETQRWADELSDRKMRLLLELVTAQARLYGCQGPMP